MLLLAVIPAAVPCLFSQALTGDLTIDVTDPNGASVANARLELTSVGEASKLTGSTNSIGNFVFGQLRPGMYRLKVVAAGFQQQDVNDISIAYAGSTGQKLPQRRNLNIGSFDPSGTAPISARVPYPDYGFILYAYNGGWSSYQAFTARYERRFRSGLYLS